MRVGHIFVVFFVVFRRGPTSSTHIKKRGCLKGGQKYTPNVSKTRVFNKSNGWDG